MQFSIRHYHYFKFDNFLTTSRATSQQFNSEGKRNNLKLISNYTSFLNGMGKALSHDYSTKRIVNSEVHPMYHCVLRPGTTLKRVPPLYRQVSGFVDKRKFDLNHLCWPLRKIEQHLQYPIVVMARRGLKTTISISESDNRHWTDARLRNYRPYVNWIKRGVESIILLLLTKMLINQTPADHVSNMFVTCWYNKSHNTLWKIRIWTHYWYSIHNNVIII